MKELQAASSAGDLHEVQRVGKVLSFWAFPVSLKFPGPPDGEGMEGNRVESVRSLTGLINPGIAGTAPTSSDGRKGCHLVWGARAAFQYNQGTDGVAFSMLATGNSVGVDFGDRARSRLLATLLNSSGATANFYAKPFATNCLDVWLREACFWEIGHACLG